MIIRVLLIGAALLMSLIALRSTTSSRGLAVRRLSLIVFTAAWVVAVIDPDLLTRLAVLVGVGRGTDLLLYALVVAVALGSISVYKHFVHLEERIAQLARELAIATAETGRLSTASTTSGAASSHEAVGLASAAQDDLALPA